MNPLTSNTLNNAVDQLASLPGIGRKTAMRLSLFLLNKQKKELLEFSEAFQQLAENIRRCESCYTISEEIKCGICSNPNRDNSRICVVETVLDLIAIENTNQHNGVYHVLGGKISPMEGIGPHELQIQSLVDRIAASPPKELIMALSTTMEGDATNFYIYKKLQGQEIQITTIARGVGIGSELEYTDEVTLSRSFLNRIPFSNTIQ